MRARSAALHHAHAVLACVLLAGPGSARAQPSELVRDGSREALAAAPVVLEYSGYIGGRGIERALAVAVDASGSAYVTGYTNSLESDFPVAVGPDLTFNLDNDAFVAKVDPSGTGLLYAGYIGGTGDDWGLGIAADASGNAYVTGRAASSEATFPVSVGPDVTYNGGRYDAFVAKVDPTGASLVYAGYIGGSEDDRGYGIALDAAGGAYVAGDTGSSEATFPVSVGPDLIYNGGVLDGFVAKVDPTGARLDYAGYVGGANEDRCHGIAVGAAGSAHLVGSTASTEGTFPVSGGPSLSHGGGTFDAFVAKVEPTGAALMYAGYIGGDDAEKASDVALDDAGSAYLTGETHSGEATFPVAVGPDLTAPLATNMFVAKVEPGGSGLVYCGYIGGSGGDIGGGIDVDGTGSAYVSGTPQSPDMPVLGGPDLTWNGNQDGFVAKVDRAGTGLVYAGYIGSFVVDLGTDVAVDRACNAYVVGETFDAWAVFPVTVGPDVTFNGGSDAYVAKVSSGGCCALGSAPVARLLGVKASGSAADARFQWDLDPAASAYNLWYVARKEDISLARAASSPPAVPVSGCAVPTPGTGPSCIDPLAVPRGSPSAFFYQVRGYCASGVEGP